jgi:lysylphosphatidylglycerol synthetase-like protein (DUF2156 family)
MKKISIIKTVQIASLVLSLSLMLSPLASFAQYNATQPCNTYSGLSCTLFGASNLTQLIINITKILLALAGLIAVLVLVVGGFRYVTSFGNQAATESAKKIILNAIIGIVIIILSLVIVNVISNVLQRGGPGTGI